MKHNNYPYQNSRYSVYAKNGMVATTHPLATEAGIEVLKQGGNAMDAAVATAATLTVVEPTSNGIGGDAFTISWMYGELQGKKSSGPSSDQGTKGTLKAYSYEEITK